MNYTANVKLWISKETLIESICLEICLGR
jgi:hypothetical protein